MKANAVRNRFSRVRKTQPESDEPSMTKQSMAAECDINNIMRKFVKTGAVAHVNKHGGHYGDVTALDFRESMEVVRRSKEMFAELPAKLRARFGNDPAAFLAFVQDKKNLPEMRELGLAKPEVKPAPSLADEVATAIVKAGSSKGEAEKKTS